MEKDKIELKRLMTPSEAADYLVALAAGLKAGSVGVEKNGESLRLDPEPATRVEAEISARRKRDKAKFSLELSWPLPELRDAADAELKITAEPDRPAESEIQGKTKSAQPAKQAPAASSTATKSDVNPAADAANEPVGKAAAATAKGKPRP